VQQAERAYRHAAAMAEARGDRDELTGTVQRLGELLSALPGPEDDAAMAAVASKTALTSGNAPRRGRVATIRSRAEVGASPRSAVASDRASGRSSGDCLLRVSHSPVSSTSARSPAQSHDFGDLSVAEPRVDTLTVGWPREDLEFAVASGPRNTFPRVSAAVSHPLEVELGQIEAVVGEQSFRRGQEYARGNRVDAVAWDPGEETLSGLVRGQGARYAAAAYFAGGEDGALTLDEGECTCPVGWNCKHVAAIVITAAEQRRAHGGPPRTASATPTRAPRQWEQPLRALIDAPASRASGTPFAIELALQRNGVAGGGAPRLMARLMRPGARGGWVNGSLAWSGLESWQVQSGEYRADHLALLQELYVLHRASHGRAGYYYSYGTEKTLDLSDCSSRLWALLDEAARLGLPLIHTHKTLGELPRHHQGEVLVDVTATATGGSLVQAVIHVEGEDPEGLQPLVFLGREGHGVVCAETADDHDDDRRRLRLVRLARPAPAQLQRLILDRERLEIPTGDVQRFADEICPALRHVARVVSSDGSFTPPEISPPALVLRAAYGEDHRVDVGWEWAYRIGTATRSAPLGEGGPGFRDPDLERAVLAQTVIADAGLQQLGLLDETGRPEALAVTLTGRDTLRLTTEQLPRLAALADLAIEVTGEPADYRDVGESLEIGISTAEVAGERDWFDLGVTITVEGRELPFAEVFVALAGGESQMLLDDGAHFSLLEPRLQSLRRLIEEARALTDSPPTSLRISRYQAGLWSELAALGVVTEQAQAWQRQVGALLEFDAIPEHDVPAAVKARLRPYQRDGFAWLASLWDLRLGGILADDMGLGKTLQTLALICHARERAPDLEPFLVVAPTSVVSGWADEAARFAPGLRVAAVTDTLAKSGRAIDELATADVVVTTYTLLRLEADAYRTVHWAGLILDEAQYVKNHQAKTYRCVRELAAPFKLAITGTPMENNLMELWSLLSITAPGLFPDPRRFAEHYARPIERGGDAERLALLRRRVKPLVKRRTKELVARDLPAKQQQILEVELHPRHRKIYDTYLQRERQKILRLLGDFDRNRFTILRSITLLRQLSLHPGLVDESHGAVPCAKLGALVEQLEDVIGGGHRALVFSQFTGFLATLRDRLDQEGIDYSYLDGRTRRRDRVLERFRDGTDPVFLISLKAGGVGLNLTEADYCFLLDPWWNPATENQAIDRTHRLGQRRPVMVYRMIARDTIEEKVTSLARRKAALFSGVMDQGDLFASSLSAADIRGLLT
jgi:superfamily II DNA or RNA helicase